MKVKKIVCLLSALALSALSGTASAEEQQLILRFHTNLYDMYGAANAFHFYIGSTENIYVDVDCGSGPTELEVTPAYFDSETQGITATAFTGSVGADGNVSIYGDPSKIDYLDLEGLYMSSLETPGLTEMQILNLQHNELLSLDLSHMTKLQALYLDDNPFTSKPLIVGANKPELAILSMSMCGPVDPSFNLSDYPDLRSFIAYSTHSLRNANTTGCPKLVQLSLDATSVDKLDLSNNPALLVLNVTDSRVTELDLSKTPLLTELYCQHTGAINNECKFSDLDITHNPELVRLFCAGNRLTALDLSGQSKLTDLNVSYNDLSTIDLSGNQALYEVNLSYNNMDFVTLPADRATFSAYSYEQKPFKTDKVYGVSSVIDFSNRVNRPGSTTTAALYRISRDNVNPSLVDAQYYTYDNGKLSFSPDFTANVTDSVYVAFKNSELQAAILTSEPFMVKADAEVGQPSQAVTFRSKSSAKQLDLYVGVSGASPENPAKVYMDFGDKKQVEFTVTTSEMPGQPNVSGKRAGMNAALYIEEGKQISAFGARDIAMYGIDVTAAPTLEYLTVSNADITGINLAWNRCLRSIDLTGNRLTELNLNGGNGNYVKTVLNHISAGDNKIASFSAETSEPWLSLDLHNNLLTEAPLQKISRLVSCDLSGNRLAEIDLRDAEAMTTLNVADNRLSAIQVNDYTPLHSLNISGNDFTFASLPAHGSYAEYKYAPQRPVVLPDAAPVVSLIDYADNGSAESPTAFAWLMASDNSPVPAGSIRDNQGRFFFSNPDLGQVYCTMTNPAFPDFTGDDVYRTTVVKTMPMPTHVWGTFTTESDGNGTVIMTGATDKTTVYIDWSGEGDLEQYMLHTSYTEFSARTFAGKQAKCLSYDEADGVTVFTLGAGSLSQADFSPMKQLTAFSISGIKDPSKLALPVESKLNELTLNNDNISDINAVIRLFPTVKTFVAGGNPYTTADFSLLPQLEYLASSGNLSEVKFGNPKIWNINLVSNKLEQIDLTGAENVEQLLLSHNRLPEIELPAGNNLKVLALDNNCFSFATLPLDKGYNLYYFLNQQPLKVECVDGVVDLSAQATVAGTPTTFRWFIDSPYTDENGELQGEELIVDEEYTIKDGVTTFLKDFSHVICVMTNANFKDLYLTTEFLDVTAGVDDIVMDGGEDSPAVYYNLQGVRMNARQLQPGIYIRVSGKHASKVLVK